MGLLDGKVVIVTGAGGGIGREHALALAKEGAAVVVNDLGGARDGTRRGQRHGRRRWSRRSRLRAARPSRTTTTSPPSRAVRASCKTALDAFEQGRRAWSTTPASCGTSPSPTPPRICGTSSSKVHLKGTYCVTHAVYNHMKERDEGGVIINTSSTSGLNGNFGQCNYGAAKAGIAGMSRCLAIEGKKYGIRVFILAPVALTRLTDDLPGFEDEKMKTTDGSRLVSPLVVYLASDLSKEHTGKTFFVGGGRIAEMKVVTHTGDHEDRGRRPLDARGDRGEDEARGRSCSPSSRAAERSRCPAGRAVYHSPVHAGPAPASVAGDARRMAGADPLSAMTPRFNLLFRWFARRFFRHFDLDDATVDRLRELEARGSVVYVMRYASRLDYFLFNALFLREGLRLSRFANGIHFYYYRPLIEAAARIRARPARRSQRERSRRGRAASCASWPCGGDSFFLFLRTARLRLGGPPRGPRARARASSTCSRRSCAPPGTRSGPCTSFRWRSSGARARGRGAASSISSTAPPPGPRTSPR